MDEERNSFSGFDIPESNYFKMPNSWTDLTASITSLAELKVIEYVLRHTWGFQEFGIKKKITTDEFMHGRKRVDGSRLDKGTGLSNKSVVEGLKAAVAHGFLVEEVDGRDKARVKKYYALRMKEDSSSRYVESTQLPSYVDSTHLDEESTQQRELFTHRSEKHTIERHLGKDNSYRSRGTTFPGHLKQRIIDIGLELRDRDPEGSIGRVINLWQQARLPGDEFAEKMEEAKRIARQQISAGQVRSGEPGKREAMAYFFSVLEDRLKVG